MSSRRHKTAQHDSAYDESPRCSIYKTLLTLACALVSWAGPSRGQTPDAPPEPDPRLEEDQRILADTFLGPITVGVAHLRDNPYTRTTYGDVELGYVYRLQLNRAFPKIAEIRPFLFNRAESTDTAYYESLGIGAGVRFSVHEQYEENNWFARLGVLTPTDAYRERYDTDRNHSSIVEAVAGYEFPLKPGSVDREISRRITPPKTIRLRVPARLFDPAQAIEPDTLQRIHTLVIQAYLTLALQRIDPGGDAIPPGPEPHFRAIDRVRRATGTSLTPTHQHLLTDERATEPDERAAIRRAIVVDYLRQGLTELMRERYPLLIEAAPGENDTNANTPTAKMSRPGVKLTPGTQPLDADAMIEHYIQAVTAAIE